MSFVAASNLLEDNEFNILLHGSNDSRNSHIIWQ